MENIMIMVFGPILAMRILGFMFMDKPKLIVYQIMIIYSYLAISLGYWEYSTMQGMAQLPKSCFSPLSVSMLNLMTMCSFYIFFLTPYMTILLLIPYYLYLVFKNISKRRQQKLIKHYLIKNMPSMLFDKNLFKDSQECAICMENFLEEDYVTPLACDARHFYHSDCIEEWLTNKNECPLCKRL